MTLSVLSDESVDDLNLVKDKEMDNKIKNEKKNKKGVEN